jgi:hypothetical protein
VQETLTAADALQRRASVELRHASSWLVWSRRVAGGGLVALVAAVGIAWFAPRTAQHLLVTRSDGTRVCLPSGDAAPSYVLDPRGVVTATTVSSCPATPAVAAR